MLSGYAKREWATILGIGAMLAASLAAVGLWALAAVALLVAAAAAAFFRDPERRTPTQRGVVVAPADGRVSSIHRVEPFEPFGGPAVCVRIFLGVLDVHVTRSPCHGIVQSVSHRPGDHLSALNPDSLESNESLTMALLHPTRRHPVAVVRLVAGPLARTIVCGTQVERTLQRGQRFGIIKLGSTVELYLPESARPEVTVKRGQRVTGGLTVVAQVNPSPQAEAVLNGASPATVLSDVPAEAAPAEETPAPAPPSSAS